MVPLWEKYSEGYQISGELTRDTVPQLWNQLQFWQPTQKELKVCLKNTTRVDSAGMVMLIHLIQHAKNFHCHIMLDFVPEQLRMLFRLSNIESMLFDHIQ